MHRRYTGTSVEQKQPQQWGRLHGRLATIGCYSAATEAQLIESMQLIELSRRHGKHRAPPGYAALDSCQLKYRFQQKLTVRRGAEQCDQLEILGCTRHSIAAAQAAWQKQQGADARSSPVHSAPEPHCIVQRSWRQWLYSRFIHRTDTAENDPSPSGLL